MVKIFGSVNQYPSERRDHEQFSGFQSGRDNSMAEFGQIVFVCSSDFFDKAVRMKPFEHARYLMGSFAGKVFFDLAVAQSADVEFAPDNSFKQIQIVAIKKVEAAIAAAVVAYGLRNLFDVFLCGTGIVNGRDEIDIAAIGSAHQFGKHIQTVDVFWQRRKLHLAGAVAMFHPAVVFEKGNVIDGCFDAQHKAVLIVHFNCHRPHVMFNACSLDTGVEVVAHLILIIAVKFSSQEGGDVVGLDGVYGRSDQFVVNRSKIVLTLENNVSGVFDLHDAPMVAILKILDDGTVAASIGIKYSVNAFDIDVVGQFLRLAKVFDVHKTVVEHRRIDALFGKLSRQFVMAVEIELEAKRRPCRHSEITQTKLGIDEIEVVMQTFAAVVFEECFVGFLVMPGLIARTWLHCREDVHQAGMRPALNNDILYALFLAKVLFADEVDGKAVLCGNSFGVLSYLFSQRQCPLAIVENADAVECQKPRHSLGIAYTGNGAGQNNTVKTGSDTFYFITMSFNEIWHAQSFQHNCGRQLSEKGRAA
jgi:hypothetical protein